MHSLRILTAVLCLSSLPGAVLAQEALKPVTAEQVLAEPKAPEGWTPKLTFGASGSYNDSRHVVGNVDGPTVQLGGLLDGSATYRSGPSVWVTALKATEAQTRNPQIPKFLKSADLIDLATTYGYKLTDWAGPFVRVAANTPAFQGYSYRSADTTVDRTLRDGTKITDPVVPAKSGVKLTAPFEPFVLTEAAGLFANPFADKTFTLRLKAGVGGQHIIVKDGYIITGDTGTTLSLKQLETSSEAGGLLEAEVEGAMAENIGWKAKASFFYPLYTSVTTELTGLEVTTVDLSAKLSVRLAKWATLDYVLSAKHLPLVTGKTWQVQNGVIVTASVNLI